ncbi:carboxylate-amine ligase [Bordetella pertussis]|nr:carboxylate-amine ligase [Bordetella pertussis]
MEQIPFVSSAPNTLGIELELQLVDPRSFDLAAASDELLAQLANHPIADRVKPEITRSMIELNSSVHEHPAGLLAEMREMRDVLCEAADAVGVGVTGGGAHPFMRWQDRAISDTPRFQYLAEMYGYLARQFTVFGQHIHLGVPPATRRCAWCAGCRRMSRISSPCRPPRPIAKAWTPCFRAAASTRSTVSRWLATCPPT